MPPRSNVRHLSDANPGCPGREVRPKQNRVRYIAHSIRAKVVFPEPHGFESELLGHDGLRSEIFQQTDGIGGFARRACDRCECGKFHSYDLPYRQDHDEFRLI